MNRSLIKIFTGFNVLVYRASKGHLGSKLGVQSILLLHTVGRKTARHYITSLSYYRDGSNYIIAGSNWGKENHPGWFHNLIDQPQTTIQVGSKTIEVTAHQAKGDEHERLWQLASTQNRQYIDYQRKMKRRIPIIVLEPSSLP